jgi:serine/threonine-protein kinase
MGEVYRARDTKLHRDVALKVLPAAVSRDPDRLARFEREATVLAALNHPNIAAIYGLERSEGTTALAMELVDGDDLSRWIARGAIPLDDALPIAKQIAEALEAAHEQGIIHRDLKPANIKVRADGTVKVLDFGLAKAMDSGVVAAGPAGLSISPTILSPAMTQAGMILGTAAYMSPEQARGRSVDKRADIWAFGVVLFEMLTGQRAFKGEEISDVIASVLRDAVDLQALPEATPATVRRLLTRCLERDPKLRLRDIGEARVALSVGAGTHEDAPSATHSATAPVTASARRARSVVVLPWLVAGLAVAAVIVFAVATRSVTPQADPFPLRVEVSNPANAPTGRAALSPDGHMLVYVGRTGLTGRQLFVRRLDQLVSRAIPGTEGAGFRSVWWSPDGRWIGFVANRRKLMKVSLDGGAPIALADVADEGGGAWTSNGEIIIGSGISEGLQGLLRVSQSGGRVQPFTQIDPARKELSHQSPTVLADGKTVLFTIWYGAPETAELAIASVDDGKTVPLGVNGVGALGVVDGQMIFTRYDGVTMAVPFDVARRRPFGSGVQVLDAVGVGDAPFATMNNAGGLVYVPTVEAPRQLLWVDRSGQTRPAMVDRRVFSAPRISPDGQQVATTINGSIWIYDIPNGTLSPLTGSNGARNAAWSSDGRRVLYVSTQGGRAAFWWQAADGSSPPTPAGVPPHNAWNLDLAPDDVTTVFNAIYNGTFNVESYSLGGKPDVHEIAASPRAIEARGRISRDGRLVAYQSDESGRNEIYIRSFPDGNGRTQVSSDGGTRPVWSRDGTVLYYSHEGSIMAAKLARETTLRVTARDVVVKGPFQDDFDVSPDASQFLVLEPAAADVTLVAIPNWITDLRRVSAAAR